MENFVLDFASIINGLEEITIFEAFDTMRVCTRACNRLVQSIKSRKRYAHQHL